MISQETSVSLEYHSYVRYISLAVLFFALAALPAVQAQIHGVPPSVTSFGPGRGPNPGVPASVTSLGPNGFEGGNQFFVARNCCRFVANPGRGQFRRHRHHPFVSYYPVPVYTPYYADVVPGPVDDSMEEDYSGGPTPFDRRGPAPGSRSVLQQYARDEEDGARVTDDTADDHRSSRTSQHSEAAKGSSAETEVASLTSDESPTVLVFKDGRKVEVKNYAILGDVLYDLTPGHPRKIPLSDLDLGATQKVNEDQGNSFQVPVHASGT